MKDKIRGFWAALRDNQVFQRIIWPFKWLWDLLAHNFWLKILSLLMAILLWNYVITSNTSITRTKTISGLTGYVSGQSTLNTYGLALLEDPAEKLSGISVTVEAPQAKYSSVSADNVQVTLDLSSVRSAGMREVPLRATCSYGRVVRIVPDSLTLNFETFDSRSVPVNWQIVGGERNKYWYNVTRMNPAVLTVSGAASTVQSITSAHVNVNVTGQDASFISAQPYVFLDASGNEIPQTMLDRSSTSISASVDVYPIKQLPVSTEIANVVTGQVAEGYEVQNVTIQPESITVAADEELLESLNVLLIEPVSVEGQSQSFAIRAEVSTLSDFEYVSNEQVYVNIAIGEKKASAWMDAEIAFTGKADGLTITYHTEDLRVEVIGPRSQVEALQEEGLLINIDLSGLEAGEHAVPILIDENGYSDLTFRPEKENLTVTLTNLQATE